MSIDRSWPPANDPFEGPAADSDENGMKQIIFHDAAIAARLAIDPLDPLCVILQPRYHPLRVLAEADYTLAYGAESLQISQGQIVDAAIKAVQGKSGKAHDWLNRVNAVYLISNPARVKAIFTHGLEDFNRHGKDSIINTLHITSGNIGIDPSPAVMTVKAEIDAIYAIIHPDRDTQLSAIAQTGIRRGNLGTSIGNALTMQYGDLGLEINAAMLLPFADRAPFIKSFHNVEEIQQTAQKLFNPTLTSHETLDIAKRTLVFNSKLRGKAIGGDVWIYLSSTAGGIDSTPVHVVDGHDLHFTAADFAILDYGVHCHLTAVNQAGVPVNFTLQLY